jgi:sulfoxide reductase heme-binding subunit YedZ
MWGMISLYLLVAVEITSLLKRHMPKRAWKAIHLLSFLLYVSSTVHLLSVGTDALDPLLWWTVLGTAGLIGALTAERIGSDA